MLPLYGVDHQYGGRKSGSGEPPDVLLIAEGLRTYGLRTNHHKLDLNLHGLQTIKAIDLQQ